MRELTDAELEIVGGGGFWTHVLCAGAIVVGVAAGRAIGFAVGGPGAHFMAGQPPELLSLAWWH
jgi:hypothetical protein